MITNHTPGCARMDLTPDKAGPVSCDMPRYLGESRLQLDFIALAQSQLSATSIDER